MSSAVGLLERMVPPQETVVDPPSEEQKQRLKLWRVFQELGIQPFTNESVERYKKAVARSANQPLVLLTGVVLRVFFASCPFVMILALLGIAASLFIKAWMVTPFLSTFGIVGYIWVAMLFGLFGKLTTKHRGVWEVVSVNRCSMIPDRVIFQAGTLKQKMPTAKLSVHQFVQLKTVLDPFMAVTYGGREYFIAVWDEKGFVG